MRGGQELTAWLLSGLGLAILMFAGDVLVRGAVNLSLRLGIPALVVSLIIVAFGTSAPELLIAVQAVLQQAPGIAIGNVVGSNTANILLVLGVPALLTGVHLSECDTRRGYVQMIAATVLFVILLHSGVLTWISGLVLLAGLALVLMDALWRAWSWRTPESEREVEVADPDMPDWRIAFYLGLGLVGLPLGADLLVDNASEIARIYGVTEAVIGLTFVAIGTSLPELATCVMAALRNRADVALGNVIGSNIFNLLAVVGVATLFGSIPVSGQILEFDLWVMLAASLAIGPFVVLCRDISRLWGLVFTSLYLVYIVLVLGG